jgi:hypothetical protein
VAVGHTQSNYIPPLNSETGQKSVAWNPVGGQLFLVSRGSHSFESDAQLHQAKRQAEMNHTVEEMGPDLRSDPIVLLSASFPGLDE